jgi:hypothetical protein
MLRRFARSEFLDFGRLERAAFVCFERLRPDSNNWIGRLTASAKGTAARERQCKVKEERRLQKVLRSIFERPALTEAAGLAEVPCHRHSISLLVVSRHGAPCENEEV